MSNSNRPPSDSNPLQPSQTVSDLRQQLSDAHLLARQLAEVERDLRAQRKLLRTVLDETPDFVILKDHKGDFLLANKALADFYGTTPDEMVGKHDGNFSATPEQAEFFRENVLGIMARGETEIVLEESTDDDTGTVRAFRSIKKPFLGENGLPQILVIAHDVTDIRTAQIQVAASETRLRYVLQATGEGVWDWNLKTNALAHNPRWAELLGWTQEDLTNTMKDFEVSLFEDDREAVFTAVQSCLAGNGPYKHEHRMRTRDGRVIWVLDRGDVVERAPDGSPVRMVGSFADITERKRAEDHIERVNANLETLVAERTRALRETLERLTATQQELVEREKLAALGSLVAGVAHEINTPVGVALTGATLWQERVQEMREKFVSGAMKRSELDAFLELSAHLGDVVTTNLARAGSLVRNFKQVAVRQSSDAVESFNLMEAVQSAVTSLEPEWRRSPVTVTVDGDAKVTLRAAPGFVFQVVSNLVVNALRHGFPEGRSGHVRFTISSVGADACLHYEDDGVGLAPDVQARMFEPFFTTKRGLGGSGLGLHIVWNLITGQLGGRIDTASEPGNGLAMTLYIPRREVESAHD